MTCADFLHVADKNSRKETQTGGFVNGCLRLFRYVRPDGSVRG
ncbi:hypothetical protein CLOBOL_02878 [Enterocloster bolteae ATCC BAA-613]|uniref:Uncharacterized protein n=1 Tax=Enterocloster bolteae (strain ATCC BAA-613 / DSM 15670 / CCUG 46953 / JCM 12243 / WAL 16351) TaxID=411902 RepID=A8RR09_ENTBW|nr:hypothetical protein CLOBOL_02878 [Enterocloster bolteae ATCC BAA-613]